MPNEQMIPSDETKSVVTHTILSGGTAVSAQYHLLSLIVNKEVNRIPTATLIYMDGEASKQSFELSSKGDFEPGKEIDIKLGYRSDEKTVFKGVVVKHAIKVRKDTAVLVVECKDKAFKMTVGCKSKYASDTKDSDLLDEIIGPYGLEKEVATTTVTHKQIVQYNCTDWDFVVCRAEANGMLCMANDGKLSIAPPALGDEAALTVQYGATVHELDAEIDARLQYKTVKGSTWNYTEQALSSDTEAEDPGVPEAGNLQAATLADVVGENEFRLYHSGKLETPELQAWVNAALLKHRLAKVRGRVTTDGTADVLPGQLIALKGVGERFEGKLFVTGIRQELYEGQWQTTFQFGIDPQWFVQAFHVQQPLSGGLLPAIQGLHIGVVTQLADDPEGEDRILVKIPIINNEEDGIWCRVATLDAGEQRGTFFRPEIGDEVVVGFLNNDPRHAVVLGMLNSSAKPAPLSATDDNHEKGYVSRSEMKMIFNDDVKSFTLETPGGNKLVITEEEKKIHLEDQNGNKITMNEDGITLDSVKDIVLKAAGDIKAEGVNVEAKGSAQAKVEGGSGAEFSSGGTTKLKGAMVNIN